MWERASFPRGLVLSAQVHQTFTRCCVSVGLPPCSTLRYGQRWGSGSEEQMHEFKTLLWAGAPMVVALVCWVVVWTNTCRFLKTGRSCLSASKTALGPNVYTQPVRHPLYNWTLCAAIKFLGRRVMLLISMLQTGGDDPKALSTYRYFFTLIWRSGSWHRQRSEVTTSIIYNTEPV